MWVTTFVVVAACSAARVQPTPRQTVGPAVETPDIQPTPGAFVNFGLQKADWEGVWTGRQPGVIGDSDVQTILMADGTFSSQSRHVESGTLVTMTGQWDIFTLGDAPMLRFAVENFEPKEWCGPLGCVAIHIPTGQSQYFRFVDSNTVILREPGCGSTACEVTYRRG